MRMPILCVLQVSRVSIFTHTNILLPSKLGQETCPKISYIKMQLKGDISGHLAASITHSPTKRGLLVQWLVSPNTS
ncbi:hypothetical protein EUGRSUZ_E01875 [Eucalyptus grandis]|uniref:Uncharacterized protein n=2 Tax=Eucalyptus grandis TaxID=71139 RepID=A0A059C593_EUCGR|nr:hypothetical protein EUGRSUZ_E01875 [Eucalyptus grandis]